MNAPFQDQAVTGVSVHCPYEGSIITYPVLMFLRRDVSLDDLFAYIVPNCTGPYAYD